MRANAETESDPEATVRQGESAPALKLAKVSRVDSLGDQAVSSLRGALRRGALSPGQRLTVREIADTLDISLTPAREALNRLLAEGVLDQTPDRVAIVPRLTKQSYGEICAIRLGLEAMAAREGCARLSEADLARLGELYERHTVAYRSRDARTSLRLNEEFHFTIYRASAMPILLQILETMWLKVGPSMNLLFTASYDPDWRGGTHHRAMLGAIAAGDPIALEQAVTGDLVDGRARLMPHLPD
ncbi:MAG: GntR family transcriptional regulator [Rhizobiales bacterium]|nr:GntR family transcriptional regulator [Hyphomicrobiales bacterium]